MHASFAKITNAHGRAKELEREMESRKSLNTESYVDINLDVLVKRAYQES